MKGKVRKKTYKAKKNDLEQVLIKKAIGYDTEEIVEEYVGDGEGEIHLAKKKVTIKNVPPDMSALKILLDKQDKSVTDMTDEELEQEKIRLINLLKESQKEKEKK